MLSPVLIAVLFFVLVTGLVGAVAMLLKSDSGEKVNRRLDAVVGRGGAQESSADMLLRQAMSEIQTKSLMERLTPEFFKIEKTFEQADVKMKPSMLFGISLGLGFVMGVVNVFLVNVYLFPVGFVMGFVMPWIWLWFKRKMRLGKFAAQLPDAMELIARALRAGNSLASGMHVVSTEMPEPISKEFGRCYEEQNLGVPLEDTLDGLSKRIPNLDLRFFVTSVAIQRQTGGDLAEILDRIGYIIRQRFKILGQVKALTAEGKLSGLVLVALPIGLFLMMLYLKPDYISMLWTEPMGVKMSIGAIILMLIGCYAIKKIIDIKV